MPKLKTQKEFIEDAIRIYGTKYDYSMVRYNNSRTKIIIICKQHGTFLQTPSTHKRCGCPKCSPNAKLTTEYFIERAKKVHGDKYIYSLVKYQGMSIKIKIICLIHGIFQQSPDKHLAGQGCMQCSYVERGKQHSLNTEKFIKKANKIHKNQYDYSLVNYKNNRTKVKIICLKHGTFLQLAYSHLYGQGCPKCYGSIKLTNETFILRSKDIHQNKYDYSRVLYVNGKTKIKIICKQHGEFLKKRENHLCGSGCPKCQESKGERKIRMWLEDKSIPFEQQKTFDKCKYKRLLKFDFYLPDKNLCIEYDGQQHFNKGIFRHTIDEALKEKDNIKNKFCLDNNIKLIRIPYWMLSKIEPILMRNI